MPDRSQSAFEVLQSRLRNFRLLEAAGICDTFAMDARLADARPGGWWGVLATVARNYRAVLLSSTPAHPTEFSMGTALCDHPDTGDIQLEIRRVVAEFDHWRTHVEGGEAYIAFLQGYAGFAELDDQRGPDHLARALQITDESFPLSDYLRRCILLLTGDPRAEMWMGGPMSSYDAFQATADYMQKVFSLEKHPFEDIARFSLLPGPLSLGDYETLDVRPDRPK